MGQDVFRRLEVLIDCGSEINYISEKCVKRLRIRKYNCNLAIDGLSTMQYFASKGVVTCTLKPLLEIEAVILPKICEDTFRLTNYKNWSHIKNPFGRY